MTETNVSIDELIKAREELINLLQSSLTDNEKSFLLSFKKLKPEWNLLETDRVKDLPAVKWKLINLNKMDKDKRNKLVVNLEGVLSDL